MTKTEQVRVLQYNVQFRSWGMEAGAQGSLTPYTSVEERANLIADRVLSASYPWDVLCFNEVFDEDGRDVLKDRLSDEYPYCVVKADADDRLLGTLAVIAGGALAVAGGPLFGIALGLLGVEDLRHSWWEDSGLMLFSKLPFREVPVPSELLEVAAQYGLPLDDTFPRVAYVPYSEAADADENAAKGVVYAELVTFDDEPFHILISHTQSDPTDGIGNNAGIRRKQFETVMTLLEKMIGPGPYDTHEEILFCGDFNVQGLKDANGARPEWSDLFERPGSPFEGLLHDTWVAEQCPGGFKPSSRRLPADCDPGFTAAGQRLDYMLRPAQYYSERMVTQHICIAHDVAQAPLGQPSTFYTSDHLPLSIDLRWGTDHNTAETAQKVPITLANPVGAQRTTLSDGEMHWFRIDEPGGYGFGVSDGADLVDFEVYTKADLSVPYKPYNATKVPAGDEEPEYTRYSLAHRPFFVRLFLRPGVTYAACTFWARRFSGTSFRDAIPLLRSWPLIGEARRNVPHSLDLGETPDVDERDSVYFYARLEDMPAHVASLRGTVSLKDNQNDAFGLIVFRDDGGSGLELIEEVPAGPTPSVTFDYRRGGWLYILVHRQDASYHATQFVVEFEVGVSYLYSDARDPRGRPVGGDARLFCLDETDGFLGSESGSDDIQINVNVNGRNVVHIPNNDALEFDDDTLRDIVMPTVGYPDKAVFGLAELDDTSVTDRADVKIPQWNKIDPKTVVSRDGPHARARFDLRFESDDGHYQLEITLSPEPPAGP